MGRLISDPMSHTDTAHVCIFQWMATTCPAILGRTCYFSQREPPTRVAAPKLQLFPESYPQAQTQRMRSSPSETSTSPKKISRVRHVARSPPMPRVRLACALKPFCHQVRHLFLVLFLLRNRAEHGRDVMNRGQDGHCTEYPAHDRHRH